MGRKRQRWKTPGCDGKRKGESPKYFEARLENIFLLFCDLLCLNSLLHCTKSHFQPLELQLQLRIIGVSINSSCASDKIKPLSSSLTQERGALALKAWQGFLKVLGRFSGIFQDGSNHGHVPKPQLKDIHSSGCKSSALSCALARLLQIFLLFSPKSSWLKCPQHRTGIFGNAEGLRIQLQ